MKNYKRINEDLELKLWKTQVERDMHYTDSRAFQKLSVLLGGLVLFLIIYIVTL
jgi:hypothetical protein